MPNLSAPWAADYDAQATWSDWLQFTSGAAQEYYSKWGSDSSGWFAGSDWTYRQKFQTLTEQAGKIFLGITYAPKADTRSMAWARANFLLFDEPASNSALMFELSDPEAQDPVLAALDGRRRHACRRALPGRLGLAAQLHRRHGVVNPTASTVTVPLGSPTFATTAPRPRRSRSARRAARSCAPSAPGRSAAAAAAAAATAPGDPSLDRPVSGPKVVLTLDGLERLTRRRLPQRRPQGDRRQHRLRTPTTSAQGEGDVTPTRSARPGTSTCHADDQW